MVIGKPSQILYKCSFFKADNPLYYHRSKPHLWFLTGYGPLGCSTYRYSNTVTRQQQLNSSRPNQAKSIQKVQRNQYFTEVATMKTITLWSLLGLALLSFQIVHANEDQVKDFKDISETCQTGIIYRLMEKIPKFIRPRSSPALGDVWISSPRWRNSSTRTLKRNSNALHSKRFPEKVQNFSFITPMAKNWREWTSLKWNEMN